MLNNLISNAVKFTRNGGIVSIYAFMHKAGVKLSDQFKALSGNTSVHLPDDDLKNAFPSLVIAVSDTGIGIYKEGISQLFNKFSQLEVGAFRAKKGTGLGLVIAKGIVEGHGGGIGVASKEGVGSIFYFMLPLEKSGV